ncbi:hypothetical protein [Butyricimonas paravirosa]|uniref:hypothetical protein n=1 Tax=Butyricimonas paravirosa TaxID=1472417 RepID=UPI0022E387C5|nr:hypothetical protein [Butyricimonas paravirosa]
MQNNHIIGGEFDVDLQSFQCIKSNNDSLEGVYKYSSGRSALYYILLDVQKRYGITTVYFPDYLCSSVVMAAQKCQMKVVFYNLNDQLEIDAERFPMPSEAKVAVLLINYFGLKNLEQQVAFVRSISKNAIIIEDDVQAFYEFQKKELIADYKFTSLRKTFACPDGGLVKTHNELAVVAAGNKFHQYKFAGSVLKSLRKPEYYGDDVYLHLFEKGESYIDDEIMMGMSQMSQEIIVKNDLERIAYIRQRNAKQVLEGLKILGVRTVIPVLEGKTPLFIPIWLDDRNKVRKRMFQQRIFCPIHWPLEGMNVQKGAEMAEHEMSIIIDQRYVNKDMDSILNTLEIALK